jgi:predicted DNA-binding protein YlxM (UPF0122 family)
MKAKLGLINQQIFESIQEVQDQTNARTCQEVFEYIKKIDTQLNDIFNSLLKVKERSLKSELFEELQECKNKTGKIMEILRG